MGQSERIKSARVRRSKVDAGWVDAITGSSFDELSSSTTCTLMLLKLKGTVYSNGTAAPAK